MSRGDWAWRSDIAEPPLAHKVELLPASAGYASASISTRAVDQPSFCGVVVEWRPLQYQQKVCVVCAARERTYEPIRIQR